MICASNSPRYMSFIVLRKIQDRSLQFEDLLIVVKISNTFKNKSSLADSQDCSRLICMVTSEAMTHHCGRRVVEVLVVRVDIGLVIYEAMTP